MLIFGGAGFIGSHLVRRFAAGGWCVTVVDGLLPSTGGNRAHLEDLAESIVLLPQPIESLADLTERLSTADVVIDAMAWTSHLQALQDPEYDLQLNLASHLILLKSLRASSKPRVIYLGSTGQYGSPNVDPIVESTPMEPRDIQGVHKLAAESYFRVFSAVYGIHSVSLRLPNCFGEHQPTQGSDIGLIGSFIRDALAGKEIEIFGRSRCRSVLYVGDAAEIIFRLAGHPFSGFVPLNSRAQHISIAELGETIVRLAGRGACLVRPVSREIAAMDAASLPFSSARLDSMIGPFTATPLVEGLARTVNWFQQNSL